MALWTLRSPENRLPARLSYARGALRLTVRLMGLGLLIWLGLIAADSATAIYGHRQRLSANGTGSVSDDWVNPLVVADGFWSFAETGLCIRKISCSDSELATYLRPMWSAEALAVESSYDASHLVELARSAGTIPRREPAGLVWGFEVADARWCLVTSDADVPKLIGAAIAVKQQQRWELTQWMPSPNQNDHLLPLPTDATKVCTRCNPQGDVQLALIRTAVSGTRLLADWRSAGWQVRHTRWGNRQSFSYLCSRGNDMVYVWSRATEGDRTIMLSATSRNQLARTTRIESQDGENDR